MEERTVKKPNVLPNWGNERTMNMNNMVLTNVLQSPYFKNQLFQLKTYHEVVDEIYYKVEHLEPWEKGSRKTAGQVGMCGGVRGVGAGGIVSSAYCLLYKLYTLKLTRKQLNGLITHVDSPFIRGLGFMYIRYSQPPADLWEWYESYLEDEEELDVKAGGGCTMTIGQLVRSFLLKLEWYGTLFPRIPVPIQKDIEQRLRALNLNDDHRRTASDGWGEAEDTVKRGRGESPPAGGLSKAEEVAREMRRERDRERDRKRSRSRSRSRDRRHSPDHRSQVRRREHDRKRSRSRDRNSSHRRRSRSRDRANELRSRSRDRSENARSREFGNRRRSRSREKRPPYSKEREEKRSSKDKWRHRSRSVEKDRRREKIRSRSRSRSRDKERKKEKHRSNSPYRDNDRHDSRNKHRDSSR